MGRSTVEKESPRPGAARSRIAFLSQSGALCTAVLDDPNVDEVLVILTPQSMTDIAELDINPLIVGPRGHGANVADVRIRLTE